MLRGSFWFSLVYCVFLTLGIINPGFSLGGIPLKHYLTFVILYLCYQYRIPGKTDWFVVLYVIYLFFYLLAGVVTGFGADAFMKILGTFFVSLILYWATIIMIKRFNKLKVISIVILTVFIADAVVAIGQYFQIPFFMTLPDVLGVEIREEFVDRFLNRIDMEGFQMMGIVGPVLNGYILSVATILAWYPFRNKHLVVLNILIWVLCILASFLSQERSGFYLAILFSFYVIFLNFRIQKGFSRIFIFLLIILGCYFGVELMDYIFTSGRYSMGLKAQDRWAFIDNGLFFIANHPLGGIQLYTQYYHWMPHNLFINMFIAGGWLGGIVILAILFIQIYKCGIFLFSRDKKKNWLPFIFVLIYLNLTCQSIVHNNSIVYGSALFFVSWGVVTCYVEKSSVSDIVYRIKHKLS